MKNECCDDTGKETQPEKAAKIIHELGKIYRRRSPDKLSMTVAFPKHHLSIWRNTFRNSIQSCIDAIKLILWNKTSF